MAEQLTHPNPKVAKVLAYAQRREALGMDVPSAAELCRMAAEHHKDPSLATTNVGRTVRQVFRDVGRGCGRGNTYGKSEKGKVARGLVSSRKAQIQQGKRQAKEQPAPAKPKRTRKAAAKA